MSKKKIKELCEGTNWNFQDLSGKNHDPFYFVFNYDEERAFELKETNGEYVIIRIENGGRIGKREINWNNADRIQIRVQNKKEFHQILEKVIKGADRFKV